jgi:hypothetical protein
MPLRRYRQFEWVHLPACRTVFRWLIDERRGRHEPPSVADDNRVSGNSISLNLHQCDLMPPGYDLEARRPFALIRCGRPNGGYGHRFLRIGSPCWKCGVALPAIWLSRPFVWARGSRFSTRTNAVAERLAIRRFDFLVGSVVARFALVVHEEGRPSYPSVHYTRLR